MANKGHGHGHGYVDNKAFVGLADALEDGAWKDISIKKHDSEGRKRRSPRWIGAGGVGVKVGGRPP